MCRVRIVPSILAVAAALTLVAGFSTAPPPWATARAGPPDVPEPGECVSEPRPPRSLLALMGEAPAEGDAREVGTELAMRLAVGKPADEATVMAVKATVREVLACVNAGQYLRALALYSDDLVRRVFAEEGGFPFGDAAAGGAPVATPQAGGSPVPVRLALLDIRDVRTLADGRVSAVVVVGFAEGSDVRAEPPVFILFVKRHERWVEDEVVNFEDAGLPPTAGPSTPVP